MKELLNKYPNIMMWVVLAAGMVGILVFEARDLGLQGSQWFWLITITTLVAGACIWIISWEDDDEAEESAE